jgi:DNA-binding XRE family transcriptional regulator
MGAPFTVWARMLGPGRGVAVAIVARLREMLPGAEPLQAPPDGPFTEWDLDEAAVGRFYRAVLEELERPESPLEHIRKVLGISRTELAHLFGVRRQALDQWGARGVPGDRQEKLATLGEISDLLAAKLKADRVPGVVRRAAAAYDGRSALAAIADGDEERVLAELRDAFDWAGAA